MDFVFPASAAFWVFFIDLYVDERWNTFTEDQHYAYEANGRDAK